MSEHPTTSRSRLWHVLSIVWIALISGFVLVDRVVISRLSERVEENTEHLVVRSLEEKVTTLERELQELPRVSRLVAEEALTRARQSLDDRLTRIEQIVRDTASAGDLLPLQERLSAVETRLSRVRTAARAATPPQIPAAVPSEPAPPDPPFTVLGVESRGGKHFLSLAPTGTYSLDAVRVLHVGESYEDWHLEAIESEAAVFRVAGRSQRITVP
jgi:hypothetical protein